MAHHNRVARLMLTASAGVALAGAARAEGVTYWQMADALYAVIEADRTVYTRNVVDRLQNDEKVIKASEHWKDDKALPLPSQMLRMGAELVAQKNAGFTYSLQSIWPINKQNAPKTPAEVAGLKAVAARPSVPYYTEETLGKTTYFTVVYADRAISAACVTCHNRHRDSPRTDFKLGDVMGGVVLRIPMK